MDIKEARRLVEREFRADRRRDIGLARNDSHGAWRNSTQWYTTIIALPNGEADIVTWCAKWWRKRPLVKKAIVYHTDGTVGKISGRVLISHFKNSLHFSWVDYGTPPHTGYNAFLDEDRNEWLEPREHIHRGGYEKYGRILNGFEGTSYEHCGWEHPNMWHYFGEDFCSPKMRISDYLDLYHISPMSELLLKAGLYRWLTPRNVDILKQRRRLCLFLSRNRERFKDTLPATVIAEFKKTCGKQNADELSAYIKLHQHGLDTLPIKPVRICRWMKANNVKPKELLAHIANVRELGLALDYEPHVLPRDWGVYHLEVERRVSEVREERAVYEAECVRKARIEARRIIRKMEERGKLVPRCSVVIPQSEQELHEEGKAMHNCIGGYINKIKSGACDIVLVRKDGKPYIDLEIRKGEIKQAMYKHNRPVPKRGDDRKMCQLIASAFKPSVKVA